MNNLDYDITQLDLNKVRVEVYYNIGESRENLGILYFERAKTGFINKPVGLNTWTCVDAKVEGLYTKDENITPTMIVSECRRRIELMSI